MKREYRFVVTFHQPGPDGHPRPAAITINEANPDVALARHADALAGNWFHRYNIDHAVVSDLIEFYFRVGVGWSPGRTVRSGRDVTVGSVVA